MNYRSYKSSWAVLINTRFWFIFLSSFQLFAANISSQSIDRLTFTGASVSVLVTDSSTGEVLFESRADDLFVPASMLKLVSTATALEILGAQHRYNTEIRFTGSIENGILNGDLLVLGGMDASLGSAFFTQTKPELVVEQISSAIRKHGIKSITGDVIVFESTLYEPRYPAGRLWEDMANYYGAPPSAVSWRDNSFNLTLSSPKQAGELCAIVKCEPKLQGIDFKSFVYSASHGKDSAYIFGYPGLNMWEVRGSIPAGRNAFVIRGALPNPGVQFAAELVRSIPELKSCVVRSDSDFSISQRSTLLLNIESPPVSEIVKVVNQRSQNLLADNLFLSLVANAGAPHSLWDLASWQMTDYWKHKGFDMPVRFHDGSGLSPKNLVSARFINSLLMYMLNSEYAAHFQNSLAVGGESGTLARMWPNQRWKGRVVAKSGFMEGVLGYAGYIHTINDRKLCFCISVNHFTQPVGEVRSSVEQFVGELIEKF
ncbi:D-alanyl-D-alanine carboxypeptidase/D-alanyl-D-alanine endopeptidase [Alkaliflexus imshenetskii]|uniref:D-alanyl-D-alanine carboxypeptidase/D-alanyl-D-alanine endopeptidase n=1 Tax=Alkaliflexus imshenetskii TaxID=286730 RepID=UPI0004B657B5|nr:D-alanyl-D-alanine carboxypeptidase/D-alanyl-D-alanine-endopeptidase [Alkaliflexus imshenetskii]